MSPADLYIALWLLSHSPLSVPYSGYVCSNTSIPPLCSAQISSASLPVFGSLYDGDYPFPAAQGFPDWFFSYKDTKHDAVPPVSCSDSTKSSQGGATPSIFTVYPDPSSRQTHSTLETCHENMF
ncbi:hypothetical protein NITMOv2_3049 [Nitrospira moscoviensis]|uniref:Uncharacterized protein n=1 Tax=Nitrospira moscoviensis TaxID=42253 RepID=A0A0K2GES3_NITMO|nr:hypothetical protein NITMOv2_3049 [Nitrospira moscoviensis]